MGTPKTEEVVAGELAMVLAEALEDGIGMVDGYEGVERMMGDENTFSVMLSDGSVYAVEVMAVRGPRK